MAAASCAVGQLCTRRRNWFLSFRTCSAEDNKINRLKRIMKNMDMARILKEGDLTAIKLHFGERGNDGYLKLVGIMQKFVDQAISVNTSYDPQRFDGDRVPMKQMPRNWCRICSINL